MAQAEINARSIGNHLASPHNRGQTLAMRLTETQRQAIPRILRRHFGTQAEIRLFGSRVDDSARGGDIDLYIEPDSDDADALIDAKLRALAELHRELGDQKIDLVIKRAGSETRPIHEAAKSHGLPL